MFPRPSVYLDDSGAVTSIASWRLRDNSPPERKKRHPGRNHVYPYPSIIARHRLADCEARREKDHLGLAPGIR